MREKLFTPGEVVAAPVDGPVPQTLDPRMSVGEAMELLQRTPGEAMPVLRPGTGEILGVLSRGISYAPPPPPRLGGMATPLGVYLTDGVSSGGAGFWGLFLSGLTLGSLALAAQALVVAVSHLLPGTVPHALSVLTAHAPGPLQAWLAQVGAGVGPALGVIALMLGLLRLLPMAGTHAAEHQVVHCIERGAPLVPACVRAMPRVHPRCGTNLVVGFTLFQLGFLCVWSGMQALGWTPMDAVTPALLVAAPLTLVYWRRLGGWVQQWLATRPATDRQIAGAIQAAQEVLRHREEASSAKVRFRPLRRLWQMGMAQVLLGYVVLFGLLTLAAHVWPRLGDLLGV